MHISHVIPSVNDIFSFLASMYLFHKVPTSLLGQTCVLTLTLTSTSRDTSDEDGVLQPLHKKLDRKHDEEGVVRLGRHRKPCENRILPMADVILVILSMCVRGGGDDGGGGGTGDGGVAHGCFLWENGRSGLEGQCLGGSRQGPGKVRG